MRLTIISLIVLASLLLSASNELVSAATLYVPTQYPTLQTAVNNANNGDTIVIVGTITEGGVSIIGKNITIVGGGIFDDGGSLSTLYIDRSVVRIVNLTITWDHMWYTSTFLSTQSYKIGLYIKNSVVAVKNLEVNMVYDYDNQQSPKVTHVVAVRNELGRFYGNNVTISSEIGFEHVEDQTEFDYMVDCVDTDQTLFQICKVPSKGVDSGSYITSVVDGYVNADIGFSIVTVGWEYSVVKPVENIILIDNVSIKAESAIRIYQNSFIDDVVKTLNITVSNTYIDYDDATPKYDPLNYGIWGIIDEGTSINIVNTTVVNMLSGLRLLLADREGNNTLYINNLVVNIYPEIDQFKGISILPGFKFEKEGFSIGGFGPGLSEGSFEAILENVVIHIRQSGLVGVGFEYREVGDPYLNPLNIFIDGMNITGYAIGVLFEGFILEETDITLKKVFIENRSSIGLNITLAKGLQKPVNPSLQTIIGSISSLPPSYRIDVLDSIEDILVAYSIIWNAYLSSPSGLGISFLEVVVDETANYVSDKTTYINMIWTLKTRALSSVTSNGISNVHVMYGRGYQILDGYTDATGIFMDTFYYLYGPIQNFSSSNTFIGPLEVLGNYLSHSAYVRYVPYFNDTLTIPYWYGEVILYFPVFTGLVYGFSHDMGTTMLYIYGDGGMYVGLYSYKPGENLPNPLTYRQGRFKGYNIYPLRIVEQINLGTYLRIEALVQYEGYWQPTTIYIFPAYGIVYSSGPIDFRGWIGG